MKFKKSLLALASVAALLPAGLAYADDAKPADAKPAGPTISDVLTNSGIDMKGYFDASYIGSNKTPNSSIQVFNQDKNSFALHQFGITFSKTPKEGFGALLNLTAGRDAQTISSYGASSQSVDVTQGYIQYAKGAYTLIGGKFTTLAGAEVIDSSANTNITRSILFGKIPFTHTGLRLTDALSDSTNLIVGVNNGWDQVTDTNTQKTVELGLTTAFTKDTSLAISGYSGAENSFPNAGYAYGTANAPSIPSGTRNLIDAVFTTNITPSLTFILNGDYVSQDNVPGVNGKATYSGFAGYLNYQISDFYRVSFRAEEVRDDSGLATGATTPGANNVREFTLTAGYAPVKNVEIRAEGRYDHSDLAVYSGGNNMTTFGLQGIYKF
ncbi:MAG: outer membrane beta-barrel protein [Betaproteobacteria bacterium]|nr:outer membrane beta-barrel protein [Betaproteobacteria bacterium]